MFDKAFMEMRKVYLDLGLSNLLTIIQVMMSAHLVFIVTMITEVGIGLTLDNFFAYNHGGLIIAYTRFPLEAIPWGLHGENIHQNDTYYYDPRM